MADLIQRIPFERPSLPQGAPLNTIPLDLPRDLFSTEFFPAIVQQLGSFRASDKRKLQNQYTDFPQQAPLFAVVSGALDKFVPAFTPALVQLLSSFRLGSTLPRDKFERTDFPQHAPLSTFILNLQDLFVAEFIPAMVLQGSSFRSADGERLEVRNHAWTQETTYIKPVINPVPAENQFNGMKQFRDSRRR